MASILDKYGIKEVADVTFYEINTDGTAGAPVLFLDSLKVSTIEQTAETAFAQGGKGNTNLIAWDYGKEITVAIEDALFSPKSMAIMFGNGTVQKTDADGQIDKTIQFVATAAGSAGIPLTWTGAGGEQHPILSPVVYDEVGALVPDLSIVQGTTYFTKFKVDTINMSTITITASSFPGTYYIVGDTYARSAESGKDEYFQFVIPKAKMGAENNITLEAEGDPSVFNMNLTVLRPSDGNMVKLIKYAVAEDTGTMSASVKKK